MSIVEHIRIRKLQEDDLDLFVELIKLFERVFGMDNFSIPSEKYLQSLLQNNGFDVFIAYKNNMVVGGLTTYILPQYYSKKPIAYIYDLAVDNDYQRQGIGMKLMEEVKKIYLVKGFEDVFVQAEMIDKHAIEFYRANNPSEEEQVTYFSYSLNT
ncbi:MAG: hypothetical protein BalsKO_08960 [Balneolaceae bacterium]